MTEFVKILKHVVCNFLNINLGIFQGKGPLWQNTSDNLRFGVPRSCLTFLIGYAD